VREVHFTEHFQENLTLVDVTVLRGALNALSWRLILKSTELT